MLLLRELLDPKYGMFKVYESNMQWFSPFVSTSIHVVTAFYLYYQGYSLI